MVGIYGIIGEFSRGKSPGTVDAVGFWPTASILFCFYGAGGRTRTDTMLPPTDFESVTSTNSITPAKTGIPKGKPDGADGRNRTDNLFITSELLCH